MLVLAGRSFLRPIKLTKEEEVSLFSDANMEEPKNVFLSCRGCLWRPVLTLNICAVVLYVDLTMQT